MANGSGGGSGILSMDKESFSERVDDLLSLKNEINVDGDGTVEVKESTSPSIDKYVEQYGDIQELMSTFVSSMENLTDALDSAWVQLHIIDDDFGNSVSMC